MKKLKLYEDFISNNIIGDIIKEEDIISCIKNGGVVYATIIKDYPDNDPNTALRPVSIDEYGVVTVEIDGSEYEIDIKNIEKVKK